MAIPQWMKTKRIIERLWFLGIAFGFALLFGYFLFFDREIGAGGNFQTLPDVLKVAITGLPIAFVLWLFRTSDTTENLYNSIFIRGTECLYSEDAVDVGIGLLISISDETSRFNERIKEAFIQLLINYKFAQVCKKNREPGYAQRIIAWFHNKGYLSEALKAIKVNNECLWGQRIDVEALPIRAAFRATLATGKHEDRAILEALLNNGAELFREGKQIDGEGEYIDNMSRNLYGEVDKRPIDMKKLLRRIEKELEEESDA